MSRFGLCFGAALGGVVLLVAPAWAVNFGETGTGNNSAYGANEVDGTWFTCPTDGFINRIRLYCATPAGAYARVAFYSTTVVNNHPDRLLAESGSQALISGWNEFSLPRISVASSTVYWFCYQVSSNSVFIGMYDNDPDVLKTQYMTGYSYQAFPDPFASVPAAVNFRMCINAYDLPPTATPTASSTFTHSPTATISSTPSISPTPTESVTASATGTITPTPTATPSATATASPSYTRTMTYTPTFTRTSTATHTSTYSSTPTISPTATITLTLTISPTATITKTCTISPTQTKTFTSTITLTPIGAAPNLNHVIVYPNPWRGDFPGTHPRMVFLYLSENPTISIFSLDGRLVRCLAPGENSDAGQSNNPGTSGRAQWAMTNQWGVRVASGVYLYRIQDASGKSCRGKIAILQ